MKVQIIEKRGKKEFAIIPYAEFLCMQEELEDHHDSGTPQSKSRSQKSTGASI